MTNLAKRHMAMLGLLCMVLSLFSFAQPAQAAPKWRDVGRHWAHEPIQKWTDLGLVGGIGNNRFGPDRIITKAEFISFVNRAFGFTEEAEINFTDVRPNDWFAIEVRRAVAMDYAPTDVPARFEPNAPISRLESMAMLYKILRLEPTEQDYVSEFKDVASLSSEDAQVIMNTAVAKGYIGGFGDKTLRPATTMTRAQMIAILDRVVGTLYNKAGTYGPENSTATIEGNVTISRTDVVLRNTVIKGDLYITEGIGDGDFTLYSVNVEGRALIAGGGAHTGRIGGSSRIPVAIITDPNGDVHIVYEDDATSDFITFESGGSYQSNSQNNRPKARVTDKVPAGSTVQFVGNVDSLEVAAPNIAVTMAEGSNANTVKMQQTAINTSLTIAGNATSVEVDAEQASVETTETSTVDTVSTTSNASGANLSLAGTVNNAQLNSQNTVTVGATASVGTLTTSATASASTLNVNGNVTNTQLNSSGTNVNVGQTGKVSNLVASSTASGTNVNVTGGQVTKLQTSAPVSVTLQQGSQLTEVVLEQGANGTNLNTEAGVTPPSVTAPADTTWNNNGEQQTGGTTPSQPPSGGDTGGGTPPPTTIGVQSVTVQVSGGSAPPVTLSSGNTTATADLRGVSGDTLFTGITIATNPTGCSLKLNSLSALGKTFNVPSDSPTITTGTLTISNLLSGISPELSALVTLYLGNNNDVSMTNLRGLLGDTVTVTGTLSRTGYNSLNVTLIVLVGGSNDQLSFSTEWANISVNRTVRTMTATLKTPSTLLGGRGVVNMVNTFSGLMQAIPEEVENVQISTDASNWHSPYTVDGLVHIANALTTLINTPDAGVTWSNATLGHLAGRTIYIRKSSTASHYTVTFS